MLPGILSLDPYLYFQRANAHCSMTIGRGNSILNEKDGCQAKHFHKPLYVTLWLVEIKEVLLLSLKLGFLVSYYLKRSEMFLKVF